MLSSPAFCVIRMGVCRYFAVHVTHRLPLHGAVTTVKHGAKSLCLMFPLCVAVSDDGIHWKNVMTLEDSPISQYSYPSIIQGKDGKLHAVYTWRRQRVAYKELDLSKLK